MSSTTAVHLPTVSLTTACIVISAFVPLVMMATESIALKLKQTAPLKTSAMFMPIVFSTQPCEAAVACVTTVMREMEEAAT